jgi:hypothetical protein
LAIYDVISDMFWHSPPLSVSDDVTQLQFDPAYDDPSANVIFISSDGIGFRVEDYYLRAAR